MLMMFKNMSRKTDLYNNSYLTNQYYSIYGYEYNLILIAVTIGIALTGPGQYALDAFLF